MRKWRPPEVQAGDEWSVSYQNSDCCSHVIETEILEFIWNTLYYWTCDRTFRTIWDLIHDTTSVRNIVKRNPLSCVGYTYTGQVYQCHYLHCYKNLLVATSLPKYHHIPFHQYSTLGHPQEVDQLTKLPLYHTVKGDLVYTGEMSRMIKLLKGFSVSTSVLGLCLQPYLVTSMGGGVLAYAMMGGMSFFIFVNPALIHWLTRRYVTDMYFNQYSKKFVAATISFFLRRKEIEFIADDVIVPDITGPFTSVTIGNKPYFFVSNSFRSKDAYVHMMGYDKPIDGWELPNKNDSKKADNR